MAISYTDWLKMEFVVWSIINPLGGGGGGGGRREGGGGGGGEEGRRGERGGWMVEQ